MYPGWWDYDIHQLHFWGVHNLCLQDKIHVISEYFFSSNIHTLPWRSSMYTIWFGSTCRIPIEYLFLACSRPVFLNFWMALQFPGSQNSIQHHTGSHCNLLMPRWIEHQSQCKHWCLNARRREIDFCLSMLQRSRTHWDCWNV